ncbi:MAG: thioredoxin domain-containing protein [Erythrobacter sp.]|uniref:DsbA family protein n=1 Tax=Erythrobacter sp. TaxID=1042 RepID=UPI003266116C
MPIPIARKPSGFFHGSRSAAIQVDAFLDIQCPHSKRAWPSLIAIKDHYVSGEIGLAVHLITLSNHRQSWDISKGIFALARDDDEAFFEFGSYLFARQDEFYNSEFRDKTHQDLIEQIAQYAYDFSGFDKARMLGLIDTNEIYTDARTPIRFASTKGVWATPTFFLNSSDLVGQLSEDPTLEEWRAIIDPLL